MNKKNKVKDKKTIFFETLKGLGIAFLVGLAAWLYRSCIRENPKSPYLGVPLFIWCMGSSLVLLQVFILSEISGSLSDEDYWRFMIDHCMKLDFLLSAYLIIGMTEGSVSVASLLISTAIVISDDARDNILLSLKIHDVINKKHPDQFSNKTK